MRGTLNHDNLEVLIIDRPLPNRAINCRKELQMSNFDNLQRINRASSLIISLTSSSLSKLLISLQCILFRQTLGLE